MLQTAQIVGAAALATASQAAAPNVRPTPWLADHAGSGAKQGNSLQVTAQHERKGETGAVQNLRAQFARLHHLRDGWDGNGSYAPDVRTVSRAARILNQALLHLSHVEAPQIVPASDGGLQAEWYTAEHRLEVYFDPDGEISAWSEARASRVEMEEDGTAAVQLLADWTTARESDALASL